MDPPAGFAMQARRGVVLGQGFLTRNEVFAL